MYLDRHDGVSISPEELAAAHMADLAEQGDLGVQYHTYWFDQDRGAVFCLAEGPSREAVEEVHQRAHGELASTIIEIDPNAPLNSFFGPLPSYPPGTAYTAPAVRAIVFTDLRGSVEQTYAIGDDAHVQILLEHNEIVRAELSTHEGREIKHTGDGIMAAFTSVAASVSFGVGVQRRLAERNARADIPLHVSLGISAGEPVTDDDGDLFGAAVQLAARLCGVGSPGDITVSVAVRELCIGKRFVFEDCGGLALKGLPDPTQAYRVAWREDAESAVS
jgi:class 3 adenylate cyclase